MHYNDVEGVISRLQDVVEFGETPILNINQRGIFGGTPLLVVVEWDEGEGDVEAANLLLKAGADVNAVGECGDTPLHRAASRGKLDLVKLLIKYDASTQKRNQGGNTPLDEAIKFERISVIDFLKSLESKRA